MLIVFDLDLTLTDVNGGNRILEAWHSSKNFHDIKKMLKDLKRKQHKLGIITRGVRNEVIDFLDNVNLLKYFEIILGADSLEENEEETDEYWGEKKRDLLHALKESFNVKDNEMVFLDDMKYNIAPCKAAGFNVIHIEPNGSKKTIELLYRYLR
jgi:HAD superfamily phosphatase (TIGR01681 family)